MHAVRTDERGTERSSGELSFGSAKWNCLLETGLRTGIALQAVGVSKWRTYVVVEQRRAIFPLVDDSLQRCTLSIPRDVAFWAKKRGRQTRLYMPKQGFQLVDLLAKPAKRRPETSNLKNAKRH